ncbi:hypothetical protein [Nocardia sp. NPDC049707]|uniref:hypothetical protein n=1 Tax=Nocardia sp. NPDC049707 TaxID=3154735 RepID=UPI003432CFD0
MTIDLTTTACEHVGGEPVVDALRTALLGPDTALRTRVRDVVTGLNDLPMSGLTYAEHAARGPVLLRSVLAGLGVSAGALAGDARFRGVVVDESAMSAPRLLPVETGHIDLAVGGIVSLGTGTPYQQQCLADLDTGAAVGVMMLTEVGGTNGADHRTLAVWDPVTKGFWLRTPDIRAAYNLPNVALADVPNVVLAIARLYVHGRDEGVFAFLLRLRTTDGLAEGVDVVDLPDKDFAPMPHAIIRFRDCWVPHDALLAGDWARITDDGRFECDIPDHRERFHHTIPRLADGRLDLATTFATPRAALHGLHNFARQRRSGAGTGMLDRDALQTDLVTALVSVYCASIFGRYLREMRAATTNTDPTMGLMALLAKASLPVIAEQVLLMCRLNTASHGSTVLSRLSAWHGNIVGSLIAEGVTQVAQIKAGKMLLASSTPQLPGTPTELPWAIELLIQREHVITEGLRGGDITAAGPVLGPDSAAIALTGAVTDRMLATAAIIAASTTTEPLAIYLLNTVGETYALARIHQETGWYNDHPVPGWLEHRESIASDLVAHQRILLTHLAEMVAAFDIPEFPGSPLSGDDYTATYQQLTGWNPDTFITATTP